MKRNILTGFFIIILTISICCSQKTESDKVPLDVKEAEMKDSTRFDEAIDSVDSFNDSL